MENNFDNQDYESKVQQTVYNENIPGPTQYDKLKRETVFETKPIVQNNNETYALTSLILGILSMLSIIFQPILGIFISVIASIIGIVLGVKGKDSKYAPLSTAGLILSIIALVFVFIMVFQIVLFGSVLVKAFITNFSPYQYYFK